MTVTKNDLTEYVSLHCQVPHTQGAAIVQAVLLGVAESLSRGERVEIRGFGSFRVRERGPRLGRNPATGASVHIPARRIPYFRPGKAIKQRL